MTELPKIPKSAVAVLKITGVESLEDCATWPAAELAGLRGFGPKAFATVQDAMAATGLTFDESSPKRSEPVNIAMAKERMKAAPVIPDGPTDLPIMGSPVRRSLAGIDVHDLTGVSKMSRDEFLALHSVGPSALKVLEPAFAAKGLRFRDNESSA